jgi:hypothetical protein
MRREGDIVTKGIGIAVAAMLTVPAITSGQTAPAAPEGRRSAIKMMESVLSRAVLTGAENLAEQLGSGNPNMQFFTGQARARGFVLDGYGVFFQVEIPEMQQSVVFSVVTLERDAALASAIEPLKRLVDSSPEGPTRIHGELALKSLQNLIAPVPSMFASPNPAVARGAIRSAETTAAPAPTAAASVSDAPIPPVSGLMMRDPSAAYREAIKAALVDAMLEYSRGMSIHPDEWLTVAAHRGDSPLSPNEIVTSSTLVLRIKGSDLALYDADRSRKEEIRKRVEVREF